MSAPTSGREGGVWALLPIFLRTRGAALGAVAAALAAALVVALHALTQAVTPSPEQRAQGVQGGFENSMSGVATVPLGSGPLGADFETAMRQAGARSTGAQFFVVDVSGGDRGSSERIRYVETDLSSQTPAGSARLLTGAAPTMPGAACLSPTLQAEIGDQSSLTFFSGALVLTPGCTAVDEQMRDERTVYATPGTWAQAGGALGDEAVKRLGVTADLNVYWSGGDTDEVAGSVRSLAGSFGGRSADVTVGAAGGVSDVQTRAALLAEPRTFNAVRNIWVFLVPLILLPALSCGVAAWGGTALLARSARTLHDLGLRRRRVRMLTWALPSATTVAGTLLGICTGVLLGWGTRIVLAQTLSRPLGPWTGVPAVLGIVVASSVVGLGLGAGVASLRLSERVRKDFAWARRRSLPWPSIALLAGLAALCLFGAVFLATGESSSRRTAAVILVALAVVLLVPATVTGDARRGIRAGAGDLVTARMVTARGGTWIVMILFGLQAAVATGGVTMAVSGVESTNDRIVQTVPADQARLQLIQIADESLKDQLTREISAKLGGVSGVSLRDVAAGTQVADGPVVAVDTAEQAAVAFGMDALPPTAAQALREGRALRAVSAPEDRLTFVDPTKADPTSLDAVLARLPVTELAGASGLLSSGGGVILSKTAVENGLPLTPVLEVVFSGLDQSQQQSAQTAAESLGFNPDWLSLPKPPDRFIVPESMVQGAWMMAAAGVGLALVLGLQAGSAARGILAAARALGLRRSWTRRVLAGQLAWIVLAPTAAGIVGGFAGVVAVARLGGPPIELHVPWTVVLPMLVGTLTAFVCAVSLAVRNLHARDRLG